MTNVLFMLAEAADSSFVRLFTEMNAWTIALFALGLIFCAIEMFIPGFGFFGISGVVLVVAGIVVRMVCGGDALMLVYMVLIALVLFVLMFWVFGLLITKSRLGKTALFHVDSTVPSGRTEGTADYSRLVGQVGTAQSPLRPVGRVKFGDDLVDAVARDGFIDSGVAVKVIAVEGQRVVVDIYSKEDM